VTDRPDPDEGSLEDRVIAHLERENARLRENYRRLLAATCVPLETLHAVYRKTDTLAPPTIAAIAEGVAECRRAAGLLKEKTT
jgi:hypothetical protein